MVMTVDPVVIPAVMPVVVAADTPSGTRVTGIDIPSRAIRKLIAGIDSYLVANIEFVVVVINVDVGIATKIRTVAADHGSIHDIVSSGGCYLR